MLVSNRLEKLTCTVQACASVSVMRGAVVGVQACSHEALLLTWAKYCLLPHKMPLTFWFAGESLFICQHMSWESPEVCWPSKTARIKIEWAVAAVNNTVTMSGEVNFCGSWQVFCYFAMSWDISGTSGCKTWVKTYQVYVIDVDFLPSKMIP